MPTKAGPYSRSGPRITRDRSVDSIGNPTGVRSPSVSRSSSYGGVAGASSRFVGPGMAAGTAAATSTALAVGQGPGTVAGVGFAPGLSTTAFVGRGPSMVSGVGSSAGTSSANAAGSDGSATIIPPDRNFPWNPGMMSKGTPGVSRTGITAYAGTRTQSGATLTPSGGDDTAAIQAAVTACPSGKFVLLGAGTFHISAAPINISQSNVTLRGSGAGVTIIVKTDGAHGRSASTVSNAPTINVPVDPNTYSYNVNPVINVAPGPFPGPDVVAAGISNLTANGLRGATSVTVADGTKFQVGAFVLLDELSGWTLQATPPNFLNNATAGTAGTVQVKAGDRVVWNMHVPVQNFQDDGNEAFGYFCRPEPISAQVAGQPQNYTDGRATCEIKEIASIAGNVITFTSPLSMDYRTSHTAQLCRFSATGSGSGGFSVHNVGVGVEALSVVGGANGGIVFACAAYCWASNVEVSQWIGEGVSFVSAFRIELRDSYIHTGSWPQPGGAGYAISLANGSSEILIENNITLDTCKNIVSRCSGTGSVVSYNYMDDSWDADNSAWMEVGVNASHMAGPHHVLFEGNRSHNFDSDYTHGNAIYMTCFRNHLSGYRKSFTGDGPHRCGGGATYSWFLTFIGNILGTSGSMSGWAYTDAGMGCDAGGNNCVSVGANWGNGNGNVWMIGYDPERWYGGSSSAADTTTISTLIRDGNYDYLTNSQKWHTTPATFTIPNSMYLIAKPTFFGANTWPWVNPATGVLNTLPAKARLDGGTPNTVP